MLEAMLKQQPVNGRAMFVDMNSFFASCEQQAHSELRGRPIGVCPFVSNATCVIAASIEAKAKGVKTAMRVTEAKQLCPGIKLVQADPRLYREMHRRIMAELDNLPCHISAKSIDEAYLRVPSYMRERTQELAAELKARVRSVGEVMRCSVGIAPNLFLAKMGTNLRKPDGLMEIRLEELADFYQPLTLVQLHGINWRMAARLHDLGVHTPLDFYQAPLPLLKRAFGVNGEAWYLRLRGFEVDLKPTNRSTIGHQMTITPQPAYTREHVMSVASQLTYRSAIRLRKSGFAARGIVIGLRFNDRTWWQSVYHGKQAFFDSSTFYAQVTRLLARARIPKPVRLVSVTAIDLIEQRFVTDQLFDDSTKDERLSQALDDINFRYGEQSVVTARQMLAGPPRDAIGYGNAIHNAHELPK